MHKEGRKLGKDILDVYKEKKKKKKIMASSIKCCWMAKSYTHREMILGPIGREMG